MVGTTRQLVGLDEVASMLAVSPAEAARSVRSTGFPRPAAEVGGTPVWSPGEVEAWREAQPVRRGGDRADRTGYLVRLEGIRRWTDDDERYVARLDVLMGQETVPVERHLPARVGDRIVAELEGPNGRPAAERAVSRALAQEAAAAVGRQVEHLGDPWALPAVAWLTVGHQRRVVAAARRSARLALPDVEPGETLRVSIGGHGA
jgi:predicted DNA-binding transcriptional regulator AlpA